MCYIIHRNNSQRTKQSHSFHETEKSLFALCLSVLFFLCLRDFCSLARVKSKERFARCPECVRKFAEILIWRDLFRVEHPKLLSKRLKKEESVGKNNRQTPRKDIYVRLLVLLLLKIRMGRIKEYFLDQGLTARDIPLAFAYVFSFPSLLSFSSSSKIYSIAG